MELIKDSQENTDQLGILNRFLVDNVELEELSARLDVFNILNILDIEKAEICHSNVLGEVEG